jgi:hypothetical protein
MMPNPTPTMKKTTLSGRPSAALRKLARQLSNDGGRPMPRSLDFFWKIEQQFLAPHTSSGISNSFVARLER